MRARRKRMPGESAWEWLGFDSARRDEWDVRMNDRFSNWMTVSISGGREISHGRQQWSREHCERLRQCRCADCLHVGHKMIWTVGRNRTLQGTRCRVPRNLQWLSSSSNTSGFAQVRSFLLWSWRFPKPSHMLQILLTIAVSVATCERSFSKLKRMVNYLMEQPGARWARAGLTSLRCYQSNEKLHVNCTLWCYLPVCAGKSSMSAADGH